MRSKNLIVQGLNFKLLILYHFLREGEFGVASGHVVGSLAEFDAFFVRLQAALGVLEGHQAETAASEDRHLRKHQIRDL